MERWIEITPDEVRSGPFVIYFPLALQQPPPLHKTQPPLPPEFLPQEHIMVIRQYVCIGINQQKKPKSYDTTKCVCNFWLMRRSALFFWVGKEAEWPVGPVWSTWWLFLPSEPLLLCVLVRGIAPNMAKKSLAHFLDNLWLHSGDECHIGYLSWALLPPWHCLSPLFSFLIPAILVLAWFIKLLWQFTLMLFPAT